MISSNFPNTEPSLNLDFANSKKLDPRITFTRASAATYYDGKTMAKAEENFLLYSQEFETASWVKINSVVTANTQVAPNGTTTAETLTASSGSSMAVAVSQNVPDASILGTGNLITGSVFIKAGTHSFVNVTVSSNFGNRYFVVVVNLTGTPSIATTSQNGGNLTSSSLINAGNGWYRVVLTGTLTAGGTNNTLTVSLSSSAAPTYDIFGRDTWSPVGTETIHLWGAQLEQRSSATAYTPTTTQPITNYIPVLLSAPANVARFDHNPVTGESLGLLIEEQRANLLLYSNQKEAWASNSNTSPASLNDQGVGVDGTVSAWMLPFGATDFNQRNYTIPADSATYTWSVFVKALDQSAVVYFFVNGILGVQSSSATFTFATESFSGASNGTVTAVGNGWYRLTQRFTNNGAGTLFIMRIDANANSNGKVLFWGAQLEAGAFPTSYIKTEASQVTRSADAATMTGTNFSSWFSQAEGSFYTEWRGGLESGNQGYGRVLGYGATSNQAFISASNVRAQNRFSSWNGSSELVMGISVSPVTNFVRTAMAFTQVERVLASGSLTPVSSATGLGSERPSAVAIGGNLANTTNKLNGHVKRIAYWPKRLTNSQLQYLTAN